MKRCKQKLAALLAVILVLGGVLPGDGLGISASAATKEKTISYAFEEKLEVGKTYMDGMISVGTEMAYTSGSVNLTDVSGNDAGSVSGYVTNGTNPNATDGTGALIRFVPTHDGKIQVAAQLGNSSTKPLKIDEVGGETVYEYTNTGASKMNTKFEEVEVKAGKTYYIYAKGTKMRFYSIDYTYEEEVQTAWKEKTVEYAFEEKLEVGKTYMDGMISVGTEMAYTSGSVNLTDVSGNDAGSVSGYVTNGTNPNATDGTGALIRFVPAYDGKIQVAAQLGNSSTKPLKIDEVGGETVYEYTNTGASKMNTKFEEVEVKAGKTYYIYAKGTKMRFYSITYTYMVEVSDELPKIELVDGVKAFPTAEGGGMYATGGRGGDVYVVTSLADDGSEGTLRYGIENAPEEGRIIVFNVGGTIYLEKTLKLADNITLAGQTAPGEGITIAGYDTNISDTENVVIRFVHFRPGTAGLADGGDSIDALWGRDMDTFIIDHCSFSWNTDECLSTYRGQNGTVQWSIISESLTVSGHSKGRHGYGGIFGSDNTVFQYNLLANHTSRNPRIGGGYMKYDDGDHVARVQVSNNVTYNHGYFACYGGGNAYTNYINNYLKTGPGTRDKLQNSLIDYGETDHVAGVYIAGNVLENKNGKVTDNNSGVTINKDAVRAEVPYEADAFDTITLRSAEDAYDLVLAQAGVTYPRRDAIDARVIQQVEDNTGFYINTQDEVGGYCAPEESRAADFDTDMDGIPDTWEDANGLDKNDKLDSRTLNSEGYAWVEVYFNELVGEVVASDYEAENPTVTIDMANNTMINEGDSITVTANVTANNGGSVDRVEFFKGGEKVGTADSAPFSYTYSGLADGTYDISVRAFDDDENATQSNTHKLHVNSTAGTGEWTVTDIGNPGVKSTASYVDGVMTLKGAGKVGKAEGSVAETDYADATKDNYGYVYKKFTGDMELITRLDSYIIVDNHTYNGIMFRESLDADAASVGLGFSMNKIIENTVWSAFMVNRPTTGGNMSVISETIDSADGAANAGIPFVHDLQFKDLNTYYGIWLKLARTGDSFTGYVSEDGVAWTTVGTLEVDLPEEFYVGLAVDAGEVANDIENYATAKFSNIQIYTDFATISYEVNKLNVNGADRVASGEDLVITLSADTGYLLPESVEVTKDGVAVPFTYDAATGKITLEDLDGDYVVKATGVKRQVTKVAWEEVDDDNLMTVEEVNGVITATHTGTDGILAKNPNSPSTGTGYILFPEVNKVHSMSMKLKITDMLDTANPKYTGAFVGIFDIEGSTFNSLGFRTDDGKGGAEALAGYWTKSVEKGAGNGSPKQPFSENLEYTIKFTSNNNGGFKVTFSAEDGSVTSGMDSKEFKSNEGIMNEAYLAANGARYGIALIGATVEISELTLIDHEGNEIYPGAALPDSTDATLLEIANIAIENTGSAAEAFDIIKANADNDMIMAEMEANEEFAAVMEDLAADLVEEGALSTETIVTDAAKELLGSANATMVVEALDIMLSGVDKLFEKFDVPAQQEVIDTTKYPHTKNVQIDIKLVDEDGNVVQPKWAVKVKLPIPGGFDLSKALKLLHYKADGSCEEVSYTKVDNMAEFTTDSFSTFVFVGEAESTIAPTPTPGGSGVVAPNPTPGPVVTPEPDDDEDDDDDDDDEKVPTGNSGNTTSGGKFSPKTFFEEGSFIHNILWPENDKQEAQTEQSAGAEATENVVAEAADDAQVAAGVAVQSAEKEGNNMFVMIIVAAVAVIAASGVVLFRKKNEEEM